LIEDRKRFTSMRKKKLCQGVVVPMVTPFTENGKIDIPAAERISSYLLENDAFPFILGTTGESLSIPHNERLPFVKSMLQAVQGEKLVYAGIGSLCVEDSVRDGRAYLDAGVGVVVAHLPSYYSLTPDQMKMYFEYLADAIRGPVMIYNITATTHMSIPIDVVKHLSEHPDIIGIKDSERDPDRLESLIKYCAPREDFSHLIGWGAKSQYALSLGSDGLVPSTGNIVPGLFTQLYNAVHDNNMKIAEELQKLTDRIADIYQKSKTLGESLAALKVMMQLKGLCDPHMLLPLTGLSDEEERNIKNAFSTIPELCNTE
jgi:dihydrodipicolinate synthase/N-acetylneuraminate lyase